jgi:hypothetical protein
VKWLAIIIDPLVKHEATTVLGYSHRVEYIGLDRIHTTEIASLVVKQVVELRISKIWGSNE